MHFIQAAQEVLQQAAQKLNETNRTWANSILTDDENQPADWLDAYFRADRLFRWKIDAEELAETLADCLGERIGEVNAALEKARARKKEYERPVLKILVLEDMIVTSTDPYEFDVDWGYNIF